ncbi:MAG: deoxyuridine 5'-triphosphate nucleotidohydrolase [Flavobacteriaceae bacterium]|nr:deoxyuridine 5'-triphosphate nucleotidohydrolase [Flavobacteriaceae bacterium]
MLHRLSLLLLFLVILSACGTARRTASANKSIETETIVQSHRAASPAFNTLAARMQVVYEDEDQLQSITVSLRMEKDKAIWIKASLLGITMAKVLITPTQVQYYETIGGTYFDGDFALLGEWLGTEIDFNQAQAILLGQSLFRLNPDTYTASVVQDKYKLQPLQQPQDFIHSVLLLPKSFKVYSETLSQPSKGRNLSVRYGPYEQIEANYFPTEIEILATGNDSKTRITMNYRKIDVDVSVSFPFTIPEGYDKIKL